MPESVLQPLLHRSMQGAETELHNHEGAGKAVRVVRHGGGHSERPESHTKNGGKKIAAKNVRKKMRIKNKVTNLAAARPDPDTPTGGCQDLFLFFWKLNQHKSGKETLRESVIGLIAACYSYQVRFIFLLYAYVAFASGQRLIHF